jgi:hypothetical protein
MKRVHDAISNGIVPLLGFSSVSAFGLRHLGSWLEGVCDRAWILGVDRPYVSALAVILLVVFTLHIVVKAGFVLPGVEFMDAVAFGYIVGFAGGVFFARRRYQ